MSFSEFGSATREHLLVTEYNAFYVYRTAQLVFEFPASVLSMGQSADVNSLCPEKLSINLFELAWTPGVQDTVQM